jgi:hypothetical protein
MKKEYSKPTLAKHGKLEQQTKAGASGSDDGGRNASS